MTIRDITRTLAVASLVGGVGTHHRFGSNAARERGVKRSIWQLKFAERRAPRWLIDAQNCSGQMDAVESSMSGSGTFSGTKYQAQTAAYVAVNAIAQTRLYWQGTEDDTPSGYSAETGGPGDDFAVTLLADSAKSFEVQAKHGLTGGQKLRDTVETIAAKLRGGADAALKVVLAVDPSSSVTVRSELARDLERLRSGRMDGLKSAAKDLLTAADDMPDVLRRLTVVCVDTDDESSAQTKEALAALRQALVDPSQASLAWTVLVDDANTACAHRLGRTRKHLVEILRSKNIKVKPPAAEEHRVLDSCRDLLRKWYVDAAIDRLRTFEREMTKTVRQDSEVQYQLHALVAQSEVQTTQYKLARETIKRALDYKPDDPNALRLAANAASLDGDQATAAAMIKKAVALAKLDVKIWALWLRIADEAKEAIPAPPAIVAQSYEYRFSEALCALNRGDISTALESASTLMSEGNRESDLLLLRAEALLQTPDGADVAQAGEAERLCSEVLEGLRNERHPNVKHALSLRCSARNLLHDESGAASDGARLQEIAPSDSQVIRALATLRVAAGDFEGALAILRHEAVNGKPTLLALRAQLKQNEGKSAAARLDAQKAVDALGAEDTVDTILLVADAQWDVKEVATCQALLDRPDVRDSTHSLRFVLSARIAFLQGRIDDGRRLFRSAASVSKRFARIALLELAEMLAAAGHQAEAVSVLREFEPSSLDERELRVLVMCLFETGEIQEAHTVLDGGRLPSPTPDWALLAKAEIAILSEDLDSAIALVREIIAQGDPDRTAQLWLAGLLFENGRPEDARAEALSILDCEPLLPMVRSRTALLLAHLKQSPQAIDAAFLSYRQLRGNPRAYEALIQASRLAGDIPREVDTVGANIYVKLTRGAQSREYSVFATEPIDHSRSELSADEADALGILGKKICDVVLMRGAIGQEEWVVEQVLDAVHRGVQEAFANYERFFPAENFIRGFPTPTGATVEDASPLISVVALRKQHAARVLKQYAQQGLPLGVVANVLGRSIPEVMDMFAHDTDTAGLVVEFPDSSSWSAANQTALAASEIVVTRSALASAEALGLLATIRERYTLLAPRSLLNVLREAARDAEKMEADGHSTIGPGDTGLSVRTFPAHDPLLVAHRNAIQSMLDWCLMNVQFVPRPLDWLQSKSDEGAETRDLVGADSWDAAELSRKKNLALYADDLLLRYWHGQTPLRSFSTASVLHALRAGSNISNVLFRRKTQKLILARHIYIRADADTLYDSFANGELRHDQITQIFTTLTYQPTLGDAAAVAGAVLKMTVIAPIGLMSLSQVVKLIFSALVKVWSAPQVVNQLLVAAREQLKLLQVHFSEVERELNMLGREHMSEAMTPKR